MSRDSLPRIYAGILAVFTFCAAGCHSFNHDWENSAGHPSGPTDIQGRWQGTWASEVNGHTDKLRCVISTTPAESYKARFRANYKKVFHFGYTVPLTVERSGSNFSFRGEANLGWMAGGRYYYAGTVDDTHFSATYSNRYDHGTFQMQRPGS